jgi:hypothetical protein
MEGRDNIMSIALKDFVKILLVSNEEIRIFDKEDNLIFKGEKIKLLNLLSQRQTLSIRKLIYFYFIDNIIYIIIE